MLKNIVVAKKTVDSETPSDYLNVKVGLDTMGKFEAALCIGKVKYTRQTAARQLLLWWSRQPDFVRAAVVSNVVCGMESAHAAMLETLAAEIRATISSPASHGPPDTPVVDKKILDGRDDQSPLPAQTADPQVNKE